MDKREGAIISAYTGKLIGDFSEFHKYAEEIIGRPILIHEFADEEFMQVIKKKCSNDFNNIKIEPIEKCFILLEGFWAEIVGKYGENSITSELYDLIESLKADYM